MTLPREIARCPGQWYELAGIGRTVLPQCLDCARRLAAIADYVAGVDVEWMEPGAETPCPQRLEVRAA